MKRLALFCMLFLTLAAWAQKLYYLPTATPSDDEKDTTSGDYIIRLAARDAKAAIRMVREHADEWHISKDKIGYLGFLAGRGATVAAR